MTCKEDTLALVYEALIRKQVYLLLSGTTPKGNTFFEDFVGIGVIAFVLRSYGNTIRGDSIGGRLRSGCHR